jgi:hypothetical protein
VVLSLADLEKARLLGKALLVLIFLLLGACGKRGEIYMGPFSDTSLFLSTKLDREMSKEIVQYNACLDRQYKPRWIFKKNVDLFENFLNKVFVNTFSRGASASSVINALQASKASCHVASHREFYYIDCKLTKEFVYGLKDLYLFSGWRVHLAILNKVEFKYLMVSKEGRVISSQGELVEGACYELDPQQYEESKTILPIRRLQ